jgi:outer membrane protein OmpA-like peptidoglycan-associated protein
MKRHWKIILILQILSLRCFSQDLILNGTFADINICTEYIKPCSPEAWRLTSPYLPTFYQNTLNNLVSIVVYSSSFPDRRTYLESRLGDTLILGEKYRFSMDVAPDGILLNKIGVCLSDTLIQTETDVLLNKAPEIEFEDNKKLIHNKRSNLWIHLEKDFVASGKSIFIIIGSFEPDKNRITKKIKGGTSPNGLCSYFVDNIKLVSINNSHKDSEIELVKGIIYSQNDRHPVPEFLFEIPFGYYKLSDSIIEKTALIDTIQLFDDLLFEFDSFEPSQYLIQTVDSIFKIIKCSIDSIMVVGHTDDIGTDIYNDGLSKKRAESVADYIKSLDILPNERILFSGIGSRQPIATNLTSEGRYKNRRVEIIIKYKSAANTRYQ